MKIMTFWDTKFVVFSFSLPLFATLLPSFYGSIDKNVHGWQVSDENAYALGGIAGHAGMFSSGLDVANLCWAWLSAVIGNITKDDPTAILGISSSVANEFIRYPMFTLTPLFLCSAKKKNSRCHEREHPGYSASMSENNRPRNLPRSTRALGWDTSNYRSSSAYRSCGPFHPGTFLHTGYSVFIIFSASSILLQLLNKFFDESRRGGSDLKDFARQSALFPQRTSCRTLFWLIYFFDFFDEVDIQEHKFV